MAGEERTSGDDAVVVSAIAQESLLRVVVEGEFDLGSTGHWTTVVLPHLEPPCPTHVDVELTGVQFMDSSGLGLLVNLRQWSATNSVPLRLVDVPRNVMRVLDYSGVTPLFEISAAAQLEPD